MFILPDSSISRRLPKASQHSRIELVTKQTPPRLRSQHRLNWHWELAFAAAPFESSLEEGHQRLAGNHEGTRKITEYVMRESISWTA